MPDALIQEDMVVSQYVDILDIFMTRDNSTVILIPKLPITTRKVAVALEEQLVPLIPMESHDKFVDIIITDNRVIYKI